ncbi:MAG: sulfite exporter TauE/SafE family protein [Planctomycetota bacterium]
MEMFQAIILPIIFVSTLTRSTVGFGDAMIAMPLLAMAVGINVATPLVGLIAVTISITILIKQWRNVHFKSVSILIVSTLLGIPVGILLLKGVYDDAMKLILAIVIITFSLYKIFKPKLFTLANDKFAPVFGFLSGILGGAYNTNGPPVVIFGSLRQWDPAKFRATLQGYFLPTGAMIALGHGVGGLWTQQVLVNYLTSLPVVLVAILLGGWLNAKIPKGKFDNCVYACLITIGIILLINTGVGW